MPSLANALRRCHSTVRADEQLRADLGIGSSFAGEAGYLLFLGGEVVAGLFTTFAHGLAGGLQFTAGSCACSPLQPAG
jgi:hypothetical protein